jgi:3-hydroxyacyl-CoA dehydrogenase
MVGIDVLAHVARNFPRADPGAAEQMALPAFLETMLERRWLGDKTGQGFYKKEKDAGRHGDAAGAGLEDARIRSGGEATIRVARNGEEHRARGRAPGTNCWPAMRCKDKAARFHWRLAERALELRGGLLPEIADDAASVDRAMRAGFNWELGPFETVGCSRSARHRGTHAPPASG